MPVKEIPEKLSSFLQELTKITRKYGYEISGCGCCSSPWIAQCEPWEKVLFYLEWNEELQTYTFKEKK